MVAHDFQNGLGEAEDVRPLEYNQHKGLDIEATDIRKGAMNEFNTASIIVHTE